MISENVLTISKLSRGLDRVDLTQMAIWRVKWEGLVHLAVLMLATQCPYSYAQDDATAAPAAAATCSDLTEMAATTDCKESGGYVLTFEGANIQDKENPSVTKCECFSADTKALWEKRRTTRKIMTERKPRVMYGASPYEDAPYAYPVQDGDTHELYCDVLDKGRLNNQLVKGIELSVSQGGPTLDAPMYMKAGFIRDQDITEADPDWSVILRMSTMVKLATSMHGHNITCAMVMTGAAAGTADIGMYRFYAFKMGRPSVSGPTHATQGETVRYTCNLNEATVDQEADLKINMNINEGTYKQGLSTSGKKLNKISAAGVTPLKFSVSTAIEFPVNDLLNRGYIIKCRARNSALDSSNPLLEISYALFVTVGPKEISYTGMFIGIGAGCGALSMVIAGGLLTYYQSKH